MISLDPVGDKDAPVIDRLIQLYAYDFSEFMEWNIGDDGLFFGGHPKSRFVPATGRHGFLFKLDGVICGFTILDEKSRISGDAGIMDMGEFFVLRKYRRQGIGADAAVRLFDLFPRKWEICQTLKNTHATAFWRRVIGAYTNGNFSEIVYDDARWRGPVQSFQRP